MNAAWPETPAPVLALPTRRAVCLYSWDANATHVGGVTDSAVRAAGHVWNELQDAPSGAEGVVRCVTLSPSGRPCYVEVSKVARAHREPGGVLWVEP